MSNFDCFLMTLINMIPAQFTLNRQRIDGAAENYSVLSIKRVKAKYDNTNSSIGL